MAAYTFRSKGTRTFGGTGPFTAGQPAGIVAGDLLLLDACCRNNAATLATPSGWTKISPGVHDVQDCLFARIADGTSGDNAPALSWSSNAGSQVQMCAFFGDVYTDLSTIVHASVDEQALGVGTGNNDIQYTFLAVSLANCLIIGRGVHNKTTAGNYSPTTGGVNSLAGFTQIDQLTPDGAQMSNWWGYLQQTTATNLTGVVQTRNTVAEALQQTSLYVVLKTASATTAAVKGFIINQQCINNG